MLDTGRPTWSAELKLARAAEHLDSLDTDIRSFAYAERDRVLAQRDPKITEPFAPLWTFPASHRTTEEAVELPSRFVLIVGDFLANLRSALDHAVNGVAGTNAGDYTKFPIYARRGQFKGGAKGDLEGVPRPCRTQIERMQPYHGHRRGKRLLRLANLANRDKHKVLYAVPGLIYQGLILPPGSKSGLFMRRDGGMMGDSADIHITVGGTYDEPKVESGAPYQILFGDAPGGNIFATRVDLAVILDEVGRIVSEIAEVAATP